ncbi:hypothetical protein ELP57_10825, partial [Klebsiella pneumoniae]|nr:hypothetical protein [Klebsiella pneumoniae]
NVNAGHERTSKARIIHQIQLIRGITPLLYFFIFTPHHHAYGESFRKYPGVLYTYNLLMLSPLD